MNDERVIPGVQRYTPTERRKAQWALAAALAFLYALYLFLKK